ncbi:phage tail protein [Pleurocapsales cyanobacterium LEGE 10410]|nr:phage tail protein [Pleurocapsales cyanobacterium LEGE 10410]
MDARRNIAFPEILTVSRFYIDLQLQNSSEPSDGYFMECSGFKYSHELIEFNEVFPQKVGSQTIGQVVTSKMPGVAKVDNITLKRGMNCSMSLWRWISDSQNRRWADNCLDGSLVIYTQKGVEGARFNFFQAFPVSYTIAGVNVAGSDLAFEELELACENLVRVI